MNENLNYEIGTTAGRIWRYLDEHGVATALKLKAELGISNSLLSLALGWLAREDKIDISESGHTYRIQLRK